jgi:putative tryptophan/tyrosine transport system substrate-binding protein
MRRRVLIAGLGGAAVWPLAARAQQPAMPVIGYLSASSAGDRASIDDLADFGRGLAETGYIAGRNVAIEYHWAEGRYETVPTLVADLVRHRVAVIVIYGGTASVFAAKTATQTIPIVFAIGSNPVEIGLVRSLNRPGGNLTGVTALLAELGAKRLELLHELVPSATSIGFLVNPTNPAYAEAEINQVQGSARTIGVRLLIINASSPSEIETAFATFVQQQAEALLIGGDVYFYSQSHQIIALAARHRVPAIYPYVEEAVAGGLMSYGEKRGEGRMYMVGVYTGRILKGEKPADLPVEQPTKFEMVINLKTAKALGLTVPTNLVVRADEVIDE